MESKLTPYAVEVTRAVLLAHGISWTDEATTSLATDKVVPILDRMIRRMVTDIIVDLTHG